MATDNKVRVIFEAITDKMQKSIKALTVNVENLGAQGKESGENLEFNNAEKGTKNLSNVIKNAILNLVNLGKEGKNAGREVSDGVDSAGKSVARLESAFKNVLKFLTAGYIASKVKGFTQSVIGYAKEGSEMATSLALNQQKLSHVMRNTMEATDDQIASILKLTEAQENLGVVSKTAQIAGAQELGTYLTKADTLQTIIPIMNDMLAQQYGINASSEQAVGIATMLGKVMDGQVGALSRYGYAFDELQEYILKFGEEADRAAVLAEVVGASVGGMNIALADTDAGKIGGVATVLDNTKIKVGEMASEFQGKIAGIILPYMDRLSETVIRVFEGIFNKLNAIFSDSTAVEGMINAVINSIEALGNMANIVLSALPSLIDIVSNAIIWLSQNIGTLITVGVSAIGILEGFKIVFSVAGGVNEAVNAIKGFNEVVSIGTKLVNLSKIAFAGHPIGLVVVIITSIIAAIMLLWQTSDKFKIVVLTGLAIICDVLSKIAKYILPSVGKAFENLANVARNEIAKINGTVNEARDNICMLKDEANELDIEVNTKINMGEAPEVDYEKYKTEMIMAAAKKPTKSSAGSGGSGSAGVTDKRTAFEKARDNVEDKFKTKDELINSKITLEDTRGNDKAVKSLKQDYVEMLNDKLKDMIGLDKLVGSLDEGNILETAKNKILTEIARITNSIGENTSELVGAFNTPSELTALNEYTYNTRNNSVLNRIISTPTMNMYLTVKDIGENSANEIRDKMQNFSNSIFGKNDIVYDGILDVVKN